MAGVAPAPAKEQESTCQRVPLLLRVEAVAQTGTQTRDERELTMHHEREPKDPGGVLEISTAMPERSPKTALVSAVGGR
jgi:hypothetical protein